MTLVSMASVIAGVRSGKVVSFPTDTVPALAVMAAQSAEIFKIKQRSPDKPLILMGARLEDLWPFVQIHDPAFRIWQALATRKLPGALTLVLPANDLGQALNPGFTTIGIRIPAHHAAIALLQQTSPLLTTSANRSGEPPLLNMQEISAQFPEVLVLDQINSQRAAVIDTPSGSPSTVLAWTEQGWEIKRQGQVRLDD